MQEKELHHDKMANHSSKAAAPYQYSTSNENPHPRTGKGGSRPKWMAMATVLVVFLVLAAAFSGWKLYESKQHSSALSACAEATKTMEFDAESLHSNADKYRDTAGIQADQVKDPKTVITMHKSNKKVNAFKVSPLTCDISMPTSDLRLTAQKARDYDIKIKDLNRQLSKAAKIVIASRNAKTLDDAKVALTRKIDEANKLLADSDAKVEDNSVRDNLQQAIKAAERAKGNRTKDYQDATNAIQVAVDHVSASMQQKAQADQQAAQAQVLQQQPIPSPEGVPRSTPFNGSDGTSSATPSIPQGGSTGGDEFDWRQWMQNHQPIGNHGCSSDGSCGIG